jgi:hypothetical protein
MLFAGDLSAIGMDDSRRGLKVAKALDLTLAETIKAYL